MRSQARIPGRALFATGLAVAGCLSAAPLAAAQSSGGSVSEVQVVPKLPKIVLSLHGHRFKTDRRGRAKIPGGARSLDRLESVLRVIPTRIHHDVRARFGGWHNGKITLVIDYYVTPQFVDVAGRPVDPTRVESITLKNGYGLPERFHDATLGWLPGKGLLSSGDKLSDKFVYHSVQSVVVDGSNVVNRGQQRFFPGEDRKPRIELLFFSARFRSRDALFGFPVGSSVSLEYPNKRKEHLKLGHSSELTLPSLPRGRYEIDANGPGVSFTRPLDLSRNQDLKLQVVTIYDLIAVLLLLGVIGGGLLFVGRPYLAERMPVVGRKLRRRFGAKTPA